MKKSIYLILITLLFWGCDDGDFNISSFDFEETVYVCGTSNYTFWRLSENGQKEALIVTLTDNEIKQSEEAVEPVSVSSTGVYTVTDRVFDSEVTSSYFCAVVPPVEPKVNQSWEGISGTIQVYNQPVYDTDGTTLIEYNHIIVLNNVVLEDGDNSIIYGEDFLFGTYVTTVEF